MSTINPLFLDSTKPIGDKVVTNVELLNIILYDGDALFFEMSNEFGFTQRFALQAVPTKKSIKYCAEVWLKYQYQIQYRFVIESAGQQILTSAFRETRAGHVISDKWEPSFKNDAPVKKADKRNSRRSDPNKEVKPGREIKTHAQKPLCKPQFFDQIKSLLEELL